MQSSRGKGGASFPLQLMLLISLGFAPVWLIITIALLIYKATVLPYADYAFGLEVVAPVLFFIVHFLSFKFGTRGNLTESLPILVVALILMLITSFGSIYYMWLQTYVLRLDLGISAASLGINGLTVLLYLVALRNASGGGVADMSPQFIPQLQQQQGVAAGQQQQQQIPQQQQQ